MKAKGNQKTKVNIVTLGCSKNLVDSENLLTQLRGNGIEAEHESKNDNSNVVVINTCGFIDNAKQESIDTILRYIDAKENGLIDKIYVSGCLSQRYKDDMEREMPQVDAFFGSNELPAILKKFRADYKHELVGERLLTTPSHYAYVKIAEGCDRPCSFCAIPVMRGKHVSTPMEDLVKQAKGMAAKGTKELILIAQDLTYYGLDIYKKRNLSDLLKNLSDVEGIDWIRLQYAYPSGFPLDVLDVMAERSNICKYIDMPLQHGSSDMLKLMRRGIDRPKTEDLIKTIRDKVPGIAFRTTMIIGHPGETEKDFDELCSFVEEQRFDRLGAFTYSHEEHTHSYSMEDTIPQEEKEERQATIMSIQEGISAELNEKKIGNTYKVLFDRKEGGYFIGRTEHDSPEVDNEVMVSAKDQYVRIGDFANVKINDAAEFDLFGEIVK
ncbi:30S ribosomal protein S12 methylthiotransferase RimO [Cytophaga hutchinsonii]|uniref:Ribosomal protein uS12 methylthiotransferase RimO n=1 Tax=Cytophaga hutchinsonii (strain ATCC 33406 / DSM 1761 / CIP 103989 / NBRC 15051 / NCIMB 9469 / D465) TaxID=269798 RepID=RIMO_CYTH3|nr:30S ribosomal protein S12 methylthiotransferase RimO [Cytophaga hutchinsonii]Q11XC6.1 RecName: Full=Ribosomal protein uS12 methylthiotransferase RimO; Short=uS12 MTTase; Short=uS12 methylthiotransferase; AltName: Full=Ribosomal protein uS12 (aspartate-C(3))-methylthiotransferase; AltName: Full=Ribosome maturation factor RimO [Cytophaga hutchinsonii ATCC 33406]ABG57940.1 SSU ribosomal protein S12P methylthiotransferase [Cytophaga hutchinsonii ATCC 33406]SFX09549.1 SSU ribosomal protein S12P me